MARIATTAFACTIALALGCGRVWAQQNNAKTSPRNASVTEPQCDVKWSFLPDGTLQVQNQDCTLTRVPKAGLLASSNDTSQPAKATQSQSSPVPKHPEVKPEALPEDETDPQLRAKYVDAMKGYFDYYSAGYRHRQHVFEWQLISSKIIFVLVCVLVCSGIYFAALQFHIDMRHRRAMLAGIRPSTAFAADDRTVTTLSASGSGVSVSSPVLGVIILVLSLGFFYLYLVFVYPITELF